MDEIFKALVDKNRRIILSMIKDREMSVNEIVSCLKIGQATVSNHLLILKKANLVVQRIDQKRHFYKINGEIFSAFVKELSGFINFEPDELILRRKSY